jgi:hypothetical protein
MLKSSIKQRNKPQKKTGAADAEKMQLGILTPGDHTEQFHLTSLLIRARNIHDLLASVVKHCRIHGRCCGRQKKKECSYTKLALCIGIWRIRELYKKSR